MFSNTPCYRSLQWIRFAHDKPWVGFPFAGVGLNLDPNEFDPWVFFKILNHDPETGGHCITTSMTDKIWTLPSNYNPTCIVIYNNRDFTLATQYLIPCSSFVSVYFCSFIRQEHGQEYLRLAYQTGHNATVNCDPGSWFNVEFNPGNEFTLNSVPGHRSTLNWNSGLWLHVELWPRSIFNVELWPQIMIPRWIMIRAWITRWTLTPSNHSTLNYGPGRGYNSTWNLDPGHTSVTMLHPSPI